METSSSSIRIVGGPRSRPNSRKMSGLGIVFVGTDSPETPSHLWEADLAEATGFPFDASARRPSRWSASTQHTRAASGSDNSILIPTINPPSSQSRLSSSTQMKDDELIADDTDQSSSGNQIEEDTYIPRISSARRALGSEDSQDSTGPHTPSDGVLGNSHVKVAGIPTFEEPPRKAPEPPLMKVAMPVAPLVPALARRASLGQSMKRSLGSRKKDTRPPPALALVPNVPMVPIKYEVAPIVHRLDRPVAKRADSTVSVVSTTSSGLQSSQLSPRLASLSNPRESRNSIGSLFRNVRKTISFRRSSKPSPLLESRGTKSALTADFASSSRVPVSCNVNVTVETYSAVLSTPEPNVDRQAALRAIKPDSQAGHNMSRPNTAPAGKASSFLFSTHIPRSLQQEQQQSENSTSHSVEPSPIVGYEGRQGRFSIEYRDPWKKEDSAYKPDSAYAERVSALPSPPAWANVERDPSPRREPVVINVSRHSLTQAGAQAEQKKEPSETRLMAPRSLYAASNDASSSSLTSASPTSLPSWTPMVCLPTPDPSMSQSSSRSFLHLDGSPSLITIDVLANLSKTSSRHEPTKADKFLRTPGDVPMRNPWLKNEKDAAEQQSLDLAPDVSPIVWKSGTPSDDMGSSPASSARSPSLVPIPSSRSRRPSRKAVPKIDEDSILAESGLDTQEVRAVCQALQSSVTRQQEDTTPEIPLFKNPFSTRPSLSIASTGISEDTIKPMRRASSFAFRGNSVCSLTEPPKISREPSFPVFETTYSFGRPSYASGMSNGSFSQKGPLMNYSRRPSMIPTNGVRVSFDSQGIEL